MNGMEKFIMKAAPTNIQNKTPMISMKVLDGVDDVVDFNYSNSLSINTNISSEFDINFQEFQGYWQNVITHSSWGDSNETNALYFLENKGIN